MLLAALAVTAHAQSMFDKYGRSPAPRPPPVAPAQPAESGGTGEDEPAAEPRAEVEGEAGPAGAEADPAEVLVDLDALSAEIDALVALPRGAGWCAPPPDASGATAEADVDGGGRLAWEAGVGVASAYAYRGINLFGAHQSSGAALASPRLVAHREELTAGWFASFQATGANRAQLVHDGVGHEQNAFVDLQHPLSDRLDLGATATATTYPWADASWSTWVEPQLKLTAHAGPDWSLTVSHMQGLSAAQAEGSYTYASVGAVRPVPLGKGDEMFLGASGGAKVWNTGPQGRDNTFDLDLVWGASLSRDALALTPTGHLTWTNLPRTGAGAETFAWVGVDASVGL